MTAGRPPGIPKHPNSGRKPGVKKRVLPDKEQLKEHILSCYMELGGYKFLLEYAKSNPGDFVKYALSRFWPAMPRAEETSISNTINVQLDSMSQWEKARRVGFLLARAAHELEEQKTIEHQPTIADEIEAFRGTPTNWRIPDPEPAPPMDVADMAEKQKADELIRDTIENSIETYPGSSFEQGYSKKRNLI